MNTQTLQATLQRAIDEGWLPPGTRAPASASRPWPVVLLIALGAWLAVLPLLGVVGLLLGDLIAKGVGPYVVGALLLAAAVVVLRSQPLPVFVEQLALPALLVGGGALGFGLFRDLGDRAAAAVLCAVTLAVAAVLPRAWLRVLLGAGAAMLFGLACLPPDQQVWDFGKHAGAWRTLHILLALWVMAGLAQSFSGPRLRGMFEPLRAGWLLATLAGLAGWSGLTLFVGASAGSGLMADLARMPWQGWREDTALLRATSAALALAAAFWSARQWPALRQAWCGLAALVLTALAACMPALGAALLALALLVTGARWRLALAAAVVAAWILGAFYYALTAPLQWKALVLLAAGALLGALAWWALRPYRVAVSSDQPPSSTFTRGKLGIALTTVAVLLVANLGIWQKQRLIAQGQPVFVELVPVDPRSLMQGDFMQLRFRLPDDVGDPRPGLLSPQRPQVLAQRDARGIVTLQRADPDAPPQPGELRIALTPKGGTWVLVTDAWFFAEGEAPRWAQARYGEFRVDAQGRALLVGLRDAALKPL